MHSTSQQFRNNATSHNKGLLTLNTAVVSRSPIAASRTIFGHVVRRRGVHGAASVVAGAAGGIPAAATAIVASRVAVVGAVVHAGTPGGSGSRGRWRWRRAGRAGCSASADTSFRRVRTVIRDISSGVRRTVALSSSVQFRTTVRQSDHRDARRENIRRGWSRRRRTSRGRSGRWRTRVSAVEAACVGVCAIGILAGSQRGGLEGSDTTITS